MEAFCVVDGRSTRETIYAVSLGEKNNFTLPYINCKIDTKVSFKASATLDTFPATVFVLPQQPQGDHMTSLFHITRGSLKWF